LSVVICIRWTVAAARLRAKGRVAFRGLRQFGPGVSRQSLAADGAGRYNPGTKWRSRRMLMSRGRLAMTLSSMARRRTVLAGLTASLLPVARISAAGTDRFTALERQGGGRLGVFALETGTGRSLAHRADERFLMCSTFKLLLAAAVLARVDAGQERLDRRVSFRAADLLTYAPVSRAHLGDGAMEIGTMCQAVVEVSDNTAANLLLAALGGPGAYTSFVRTLGDGVTRLDRTELLLNEPAGVLDTTTPRAMAGSMRAVLLGHALHPASRALLETWMMSCVTGTQRLRAGLPGHWEAGDKTGTGDTQTNDLALIRPPGRAPIIVTAYFEGGSPDMAAREAVLRRVGHVVAGWAV
jgi:beta-lactamase class A